MKIVTKSARETQKLAALLAKELLDCPAFGKEAAVVVLRGELGAGKTTFAQGFAKGLGIKESVKSPTFVILKKYKLRESGFNVSRQSSVVSRLNHFYHIDCYRLKNAKDARAIGLPEVFKNPENLILIEWPERIKKALPKKIITVSFLPAQAGSNINETTRKISFN